MWPPFQPGPPRQGRYRRLWRGRPETYRSARALSGSAPPWRAVRPIWLVLIEPLWTSLDPPAFKPHRPAITTVDPRDEVPALATFDTVTRGERDYLAIRDRDVFGQDLKGEWDGVQHGADLVPLDTDDLLSGDHLWRWREAHSSTLRRPSPVIMNARAGGTRRAS